jgi:hypothetical protein
VTIPGQVIGSLGEMVTYQTAAAGIAPDARGNDVVTFVNSVIGPCIFVPGAETEAAIGTEQVTSVDKLYLPAGTPTSPLDRVQRANGEIYEITGEAWTWSSPFTGFTGPIAVSIRRVTGATAHMTTESDA